MQTVLDETYWNELATGLASEGFATIHVVLDADRTTLQHRIDTGDPEPRQWRHDHIEPYERARRWLLPAADLVVDTAAHRAPEVVAQITASLNR